MKYTRFKQDGTFDGNIECPEEDAPLQVSSGQILVVGTFDDSHYHDGESVCEKPAKPAEAHEWDAPSKAWVFSQGLLEAAQAKAIDDVRHALQSAINERARGFGFTDGNALMLYAGFVNAFQSMAQQFAAWEASVWVEAEAYKNEVLAGTKPILTPTEAVAMMPNYEGE